MLDACIEHLGRLPSQLDLDDDALFELLTYHRLKRRSQNVCKECLEKSQEAEKVCFVCDRPYTDKHGVKGRKGQADPVMLEMMKQMAERGTGKKPTPKKLAKDASQEEKDAMLAAMIEKLRREGKLRE